MRPNPDKLFEQNDNQSEPLASRMRPRTIDEYIGQDHIMGKGRLLRRAIQADQLSSVLFSGPPGTGKTTLARVIANSTKSDFISLNAVLSGVSEIREAIEKAQNRKNLYGNRTILFVDEVHRWNKAQQDALLPWVENGTFILIGATTENPYFEVNAALVSRSRVFQLKALQEADLRAIADQALADPIRGYGKWRVQIEPDAIQHLVQTASGDARSLLNALELAVETSVDNWPPPLGSEITINLAVAEESIQQKALLYDRDGDYHYDSISAFIKSVRGSDPDAALYWLARMVRSGESPRFIFRRMTISASEDIGMADPQALIFVQNAAEAFDRVGMPEGQYFLSQAALYVALAPKSNSSLGYFDALKALESEELAEVPNHLKDGNRDKKGFGHGEGYQYPHAYRDHWVAQNYLPASLRGKLFYQPGDLGFEGQRKAELVSRREIQLALPSEMESAESLSWSPADQGIEHFFRRSEQNNEQWLKKLRHELFQRLTVARHQRLAIIGNDAVYLVPEALRRVPEGLVYVAAESKHLEACRHQIESNGLADRCRFLQLNPYGMEFSDGVPEIIVAVNLSTRLGSDGTGQLLNYLANNCAMGSSLLLAETQVGSAPRIAGFLQGSILPTELLALVQAADALIYGLRFDSSFLIGLFDNPAIGNYWLLKSQDSIVFERRRHLSQRLLQNWFSTERNASYGQQLLDQLGQTAFDAFYQAVLRHLSEQTVEWPIEYVFLQATLASPGPVTA